MSLISVILLLSPAPPLPPPPPPPPSPPPMPPLVLNGMSETQCKQQAKQTRAPFSVVNQSKGKPAGCCRLDDGTFLWVESCIPPSPPSECLQQSLTNMNAWFATRATPSDARTHHRAWQGDCKWLCEADKRRAWCLAYEFRDVEGGSCYLYDCHGSSSVCGTQRCDGCTLLRGLHPPSAPPLILPSHKRLDLLPTSSSLLDGNVTIWKKDTSDTCRAPDSRTASQIPKFLQSKIIQ